jgi:RsiW-degrading membrane proteinase PrsW (M82 family)
MSDSAGLAPDPWRAVCYCIALHIIFHLIITVINDTSSVSKLLSMLIFYLYLIIYFIKKNKILS